MNAVLLSLVAIGSLLAGEGTETHASQTPVHSISELNTEDIKITNHPLCEYPDICIDQQNAVWVAYTELREGNENITLVRIRDGRIIDSLRVSTDTGYEYRPRLVCDSEGRIGIIWAAKRNNNWDIYARYIEGTIFSPEIRVTNHAAVDIRPAVTGIAGGKIIIAWESLRNGSFDIYTATLDETGVTPIKRLSASQAMDLRPVITTTNGRDVVVAWDRQEGRGYRIIMRRFDGRNWHPEIAVSPQSGFNMAPALASRKPGNVTIAWKSNLQPDGSLGIPPWIYYREFRGERAGDIFSLAEDGDWLKSDEDQGFEFPTLLYDKKGQLWIFGRPSQGFFVQAVSENGGKSPLYQFDRTGWGGRGQYVRATQGEDGLIYTVRRDLRAVYLCTINPKEEGLPFSAPIQPTGLNRMMSNSLNYLTLPKKKSNLVFPDTAFILYGDIHQHSSLSDGMGTVDECYTRSRYVYHHGFAALTDHEWFVGNLILPSEWEFTKIIGQQFDQPGEFVTIPAYEWTTPRLPDGFGHKNIYFPDWEQPIYSYATDARNSNALFNLLGKSESFAIPHHTGWTGIDWQNHNDTLQPVIEIVSIHGAFEFMGNEPIMHRGGTPGYFTQDGLLQGLEFGFIGSSDGHGLRFHHGIGRKEDPWQGGLAGIIVKETSRSEILNALKSRRCFATSGVPIELKFFINGQPAGSAIHTTSYPEIEFEVIGTAPIHSVKLLRNNHEILTVGKDLQEGHGARKKYVDQSLAHGRNWYYLRVLQEDNEMAWSSPIWVNYQAE